ncbi:MAG TPA: adenylate/guanylate cyclase domain-containing protein [Anaerolineae bacterium]|nr:adenylate/guanylate cyclase domain-containing protein [Anaerolineae bacterium]HQI85855.1 adenylate/guanylate cyclase domain-containing protein [Anaerolineae bacterium]
MAESRGPVTLPDNLGDYIPAELLQRVLHKPFNRRDWISVLTHLRSVRYLLCTYIPAHLAQEKTRQPIAGQVQGRWLNGSLLFSDVSGFTALSEHLANQGQEGTEQLTQAINRYFERMLDILSRSGGVLLKFAGDALLAYFPTYKDGEQARWAVRAARRMMHAMEDFAAIPTPLGTVNLKMKVGLSTGAFGALSVGNAQRMEYMILGPTVARTLGAEGSAVAGQIVGDGATAANLPPAVCADLGNGFFVLQETPDVPLDDYEIRAETQFSHAAEGWRFTPADMAADMQLLIDQIRAISPYLPRTLSERIIKTAEQRRLESEYRMTTVLFTNVTGFEDALALLPPGDDANLAPLTRMLSDYFNAVQAIVARYDGVITRIDPYSKGSKVLILFGAPVAHEDDPERGTRAAVEMMAELATLGERWRRDAASPAIQQRIGITHGLTFAGQAGSGVRREYTVMGDDVNLAARLMSAGTPGQILLAPSVYAKVAARFAITALPAIRVKGKTNPIPIYQVDSLATGSLLDSRLRDLRPLFGRRTELEIGKRRVDQALAGNGGVLALQGPAGIGKSHLADALAAYAIAAGARVFLGECHAYTAQAPYDVWIGLLQAMLNAGHDDDPQQRAVRLHQWLTELGLPQSNVTDPLFTLLGLKHPAPPTFLPPSPAKETPPKPAPRAGLFAQIGQKVTTTPAKSPGANLWKLAQERQKAQSGQMWQQLEARVAAREKERLFTALGALLERLSQRALLMLLFENAQWMDESAQALLAYLKLRITTWPVLILLAQRTEEEAVNVDETTLSRAQMGFVVTASAVSGTAEAVPTSQNFDLLTLLLRPLDETGTRDLVTHLLNSTEGAPPEGLKNVETITRLCYTIHHHSGGNPLFIEEIVRWMQRTGNITPDQVAAGLQSSSALQELVTSRVDGLPHAEQVAVKDASIIGDDFHTSDLAPLVEAKPDDIRLITSLAGLESAHLTIKTASSSDDQYAFRQTLIREFIYKSQSFTKRRTQHARLAEYLEQRFAAKLVVYAELLAHHYTAAQQWLPAAHYTLMAGDKARQRYAFPQAAASYQRALEMLDRLTAEAMSPEAAALRVYGHTGLGDVALLTGDFTSAATHYTVARQVAAPETPATLLIRLALVLPTQEQAAEAEACARQAWSLSPVGEDLAPSAILAWLLWRIGDPAAREWMEHARPLAAAQTDRWTAGVTALLDDLAGEWETAQRAYLALELADGAALAACRQGDRALFNGDIAAALAQYEAAAALWEQQNDAPGLALARYRQAEAYWHAGDPAAARLALEVALSLLDNAAERYRPDSATVCAALDIVAAGSAANWPAWRWQAYDDACRILLLFPF